MSIWTHVETMFKGHFDETAKEVIGKDILWDYSLDEWETRCAERKAHPERYMPMGSEGTLAITKFTPRKIIVSGALRDYCNEDEVHEWFDRVCRELRPSMAKCEFECFDVKTWKYRC